MPNFGNEEARTSDAENENIIKGFIATCPVAGTADSIIAHIHITSDVAKIKCALYKDSDGSFVGETEEKELPADTDGEVTFNFSAPKPGLENITYWICVWASSPMGIARVGLSGYSAGASKHKAEDYNDFPATIDPGTYNWKVCAYCAYTAGAPPVAGRSFGFIIG